MDTLEKEAYSLIANNSLSFARHKLVEECSELTLELIKKDTKHKPEKYSPKDVVKEMVDVLISIRALYNKMRSEGEIDDGEMALAMKEKYKKIMSYKDKYNQI